MRPVNGLNTHYYSFTFSQLTCIVTHLPNTRLRSQFFNAYLPLKIRPTHRFSKAWRGSAGPNFSKLIDWHGNVCVGVWVEKVFRASLLLEKRDK